MTAMTLRSKELFRVFSSRSLNVSWLLLFKNELRRFVKIHGLKAVVCLKVEPRRSCFIIIMVFILVVGVCSRVLSLSSHTIHSCW